jgi:hypothetical protein
VGRGGILSSSILLTGMVGLRVVRVNNIRNIIYTFFIVSCIVVFTIYLLYNPEFIYNNFGRFFQSDNTLSYEEPRLIIWRDYIRSIDGSILNFISGGQLPTRHSGNLHNSFLNTHAKYGLFIVLINLSFLLRSLIYFIRNKKYEIVLILIVFITRAFTDLLFSDYYGNVFLYYFVLYTLVIKSKNKIFSKL